MDATDINLLTDAVRGNDQNPIYDVNGDGNVDQEDRSTWVIDLKNTWFGDADLNGEFNTTDLVALFQKGEFEDDLELNSTWDSGDFNGDGEFNTTDFVTAFQGGGFEKGPRNAVQEVPEPRGLLLAALACLAMAVARRKR